MIGRFSVAYRRRISGKWLGSGASLYGDADANPHRHIASHTNRHNPEQSIQRGASFDLNHRSHPSQSLFSAASVRFDHPQLRSVVWLQMDRIEISDDSTDVEFSNLVLHRKSTFE